MQQQYIVGRVLDTKNIPNPDELASNIGDYAGSFFSQRNRLPSTRHDRVNNTINTLIADKLRTQEGKIKYLDVGGSDGDRAYNISKRAGNGLEAHVVDIDQVSIDKAVERGIKAQQANIAQRLPYDGKSFDTVSLLWTLDHVPDSQKADVIGEIRRVLGDNGTFYLQVGKHVEFDDPSEQLGYRKGTFFLGVFKPTGEKSSTEETPKSIHGDVNDKNPAYKLVSKPMYASLFSVEQIRELTREYFDLDQIYLIGFERDESKAGNVLANTVEDIRQNHQDSEGIFFAILKKK
jgi:ubiquinone/menaquinone biosynthesis C-methylase UbiE